MRRKLELDLQALLQEHEEVQTELRGASERAKKAGGEVSEHAHTHAHTDTRARTHIDTHTRTRTHIDTHTHTHAHTDRHRHRHACTHT